MCPDWESNLLGPGSTLNHRGPKGLHWKAPMLITRPPTLLKGLLLKTYGYLGARVSHEPGFAQIEVFEAMSS